MTFHHVRHQFLGITPNIEVFEIILYAIPFVIFLANQSFLMIQHKVLEVRVGCDAYSMIVEDDEPESK
jgi:hypothetical protein